MDEQANAGVVHQAVRGVFLRPHRFALSKWQQTTSPKMIAITCIRYLGLHYRGLEKSFKALWVFVFQIGVPKILSRWLDT